MIDRIQDAVKDHPDGDIMLVGFSQGGMDAQNIAASGKLNHVTTVVTFASPVTQPDSDHYQSVHLRATGDPVPRYPTFNPATMFNSSHSIFETAAETGICQEGWDLHTNPDTYKSIAEQFDDADGFSAVKENMSNFYGTGQTVQAAPPPPPPQIRFPYVPAEKTVQA